MCLLYCEQMSSMFSKDVLFYVTATPFFIFYGLFAFVLYPNRALIHRDIPKDMDERLKYSLSLLYNWSFSLLFYITTNSALGSVKSLCFT